MEPFPILDLCEADLNSLASSTHSHGVNSPESEQSSSSLSPKRHGNPNPSFPHVKTVCLVCGDEAIRHVHYGGRCCFSCKAFFRRAVNWHSLKIKIFQCRNDQNCHIDIKSRKCCQYCRFKKCLDTGMNPSWVLSDDEREQRFQKRKAKQELKQEQLAFSGHGLSRRMASRSGREKQSHPKFESDSLPTSVFSSTNAPQAASIPASSGESTSHEEKAGPLEGPTDFPDGTFGQYLSNGQTYSIQPQIQSNSLKVKLTRNQKKRGSHPIRPRSSLDLNSAPGELQQPPLHVLNAKELAELEHLDNLFQRCWNGDVRNLKLVCKWSDWQSQLLALHDDGGTSSDSSCDNGTSNLLGDKSDDSNTEDGDQLSGRRGKLSYRNALPHFIRQSMMKSSKDCLIRSLYFLQEIHSFQSLSTFDQEQLFITNMTSLSYLQSIQYELIHNQQTEFGVFPPDSVRLSSFESTESSIFNFKDDQPSTSSSSNSAKFVSINQSLNLEKIVRIFGHFQLPRIVHVLLMLIVIFSNDSLYMREVSNNDIVEERQLYYFNLLRKYLFAYFDRTNALAILANLVRVILLMRDDLERNAK